MRFSLLLLFNRNGHSKAEMIADGMVASATSPSNVSQHRRQQSDKPNRSARSSKAREEEEDDQGSGFHPFTTVPLSQPLVRLT